MQATDTHGRTIELTKIAGECGECDEDDCAAVSRTDRGTVAVQGDALHRAGTPAGEAVVETPIALLVNAVRALGYTVA